MTMPYERTNAVRKTADFLVLLCNPKETPGVPKAFRDRAFNLLRHFPTDYDLERAARKAPDVFGEFE